MHPRLDEVGPAAGPGRRSRRPAAGQGRRQPLDRLVAAATAGVVAYSVVTPLGSLFRAAVFPTVPEHMDEMVVGTALLIPPVAWLVLSAARNVRPRGWGWALAAVLAIAFAGVPVIGADWLAAFYMPAVLALVLLRPPWSVLLFLALAAAPGGSAVALGIGESARYFTMGLLALALPLALLVWLTARIRELRDARAVLAAEAVVAERMRIDDELRRTLGTALADLAGEAARARDLARHDPEATEQVLRALVGHSRRTLAEARRIVRRYQPVSMQDELDSAEALLSAAGIQTRVEAPPGELAAPPESVRAMLRSGTARLLADETVRDCLITVQRRGERVDLHITGDGRSIATTRRAAP